MGADASQADRMGALALSAKETLAVSGNCAQTSFAVLQQELGLEGGPILKALTPFPGIALRGETCGAVTGCLMAIGLVFGRDELDDWKGFIASLGRSRRFCRWFQEQNGGTTCADVLEARLGRRFNLADRGESAEYVSAGGPQVCGEMIARAVQRAAEIIARKDQPEPKEPA